MHLRFGRRSLLVTLVILVVCGVIIVSKILSSPQHGTPAKATTLPKTMQGTDRPKPLPATTSDQRYFTLKLPQGYSSQSVGQPTGPILFSQTIIKPSNQGSIIVAISIQRLPEGGLTEDSSYRLRQAQTNRYKLSQETVNGDAVTIANDAESATVVAFWQHGAYYATISASQGTSNPSTDDNSGVLKVLMTLLEGWTWK